MRLVPADGRNEFIFFFVITLTFTGDCVTNSSLSVPLQKYVLLDRQSLIKVKVFVMLMNMFVAKKLRRNNC